MTQASSIVAALFALLVIVSAVTLVSAAKGWPDVDVTYSKPVEQHHSIHPPLDDSQVYWKFGGATVMAQRRVALTPASQQQRGWLLNDYPMETANWEVEFRMDARSSPHFGGEGMAMWLIDNTKDPYRSTGGDDFPTGPVFGMREAFRGVGLCFDVYDNDGRRDNPSIFVLDNRQGLAETKFSPEADYAPNKYTSAASRINPTSSVSEASHSCVRDIRNSRQPTSVLVRFVDGVMSVHTDVQDGAGYTHCLSVVFPEAAFQNHHLAFTASTAQVADSFSLYEITTRYLDDKTPSASDTAAALAGESPSVVDAAAAVARGGAIGGGARGSSALPLGIVCGVGLILALAAGAQYTTHRRMTRENIDPSLICARLNPRVSPMLAGHLVTVVLLMLDRRWRTLACHMPLACASAWRYARGQHQYAPYRMMQSSSLKGHGGGGIVATMTSYGARLTMDVAFFVAMTLLYVYGLVR